MKKRWSRAVMHYAELLGLVPYWKITCDLGSLESVNAAETHCMGGGHQAHVILDPELLDVGQPTIKLHAGGAVMVFPHTIDELAAHEVLHLAFDDLARLLPEEADAVLEHTIERIAQTLAGTSPCV